MSRFKDSWGKTKMLLSQLLCIGAVFTACTDDEVVNQADKAPLQVSVNTSLAKQSRVIVHGEWLPAGSTIGVSLFDTECDDYDEQGYYNIQYKGTGEEEDLTWSSMGVTPAVSANEAVLVAYHPYNDDEDLDITAIPVEIATQTDYMYSGPVTGITNAVPKADIVLDHALTAIRVKLVLGNFTGDASVSEIAVASPGLASSATLNAADGSLDNIAGQGDKFTLPVDFGLVASGTDNDIMFVPDASVESGVTTVSATIGGKKYTAGIEFDQAYKQGYIYTYTLTLNNSGFAVTKVNVNPWEAGTEDSAVLQPEKDNAYIIKIVASYNEPADVSLLSSRSGGVFTFAHNLYEFVGTIDWGDGTTDTYNEPEYSPSHEYPNDGTEYTITAKGIITRLYADSNSFRQCLKEIIHIGDCGITLMEGAFYGCYNLQTIPEGLFDKCTEVTSFRETFNGCSSLQTIPEGLFDKCTEVTDFRSTFGGCSSLKVIPEGLFRYNTKVTSFNCTFEGSGITEIPEGLFRYNTKVTNFGGTFYECTNLETIPEGLFKYNTKVTDFKAYGRSISFVGPASIPIGVFCSCSGLQTIPVNLFKYNTQVEDFEGVFYNCTSLTEIPEGLFDNNTKVTSFRGTFAECISLKTIPEGLFDKCTEVTSFKYAFGQCFELKSIPVGLFDKNTKVTDIHGMFLSCAKLTSESPYTIINGVKVHLYERYLYPQYFTAPTAYNSCFLNCKNLTDYNSIPIGWK